VAVAAEEAEEVVVEAAAAAEEEEAAAEVEVALAPACRARQRLAEPREVP
jgi:hypothetical protein